LAVTQESSNKGATVNNGLWKDKGMGTIAVRGGQTVRVRFQFFDKETRNPKSIPKFAFTFYDLDQHADGKEEEFVKLYTFQSAVKTKFTEVSHTIHDVDGVPFAGTFASSKPGNWHDNPTEPMTLNRQQRNRAVTLTFADTSAFEADLGSTGQKVSSKSHRAVLFAPKATLYCIGHLEEITNEPLSTTMSTTTKSGGAETTAKMSNGCVQIVSKGRTADRVADLKKMIRDNKYMKTAITEENMYFTGTLTHLCTAFADASGSKHKVCIGSRVGCKAKLVWKVSGGLQFHNVGFGGEDKVDVNIPTSETTLVEGTFEYQPGGDFDGQHMKLTVQGYKQ